MVGYAETSRVNFLLHHHLAARDLGSAAGALGAMLPDVWRMADRRAHAREAASAQQDGSVRAVLDGVAHHVAVDARFHAAQVFTLGERTTRDALRGASRAPKLALFAHVAWELCLDGALVRRAGLEPLLDGLRSSIRAVRPDAHHRAALTAVPSLRERTEDERGRFDARVDQILDAIALGPWVAGYATGGGILERLEGVRARLGLTRLPALDRESVGRALDDLSRRADAALDEIVSWDSSGPSSNLT
jgi:hypothetical protein